MIDYTKLLKRLNPEPGGEDVLRLRVGVVTAVNSGGLVDVTISGVSVPDVPVLAGVQAPIGAVVQILSLRGSLLVLGASSSGRTDHVGRLVPSGAQTLADNTQVALAFNAEDFDTGGFHSTSVNNSRVTPTVAGYYDVRGTFFTSSLVTGVTIDVNIRSNGSVNHAPGSRLGGAAGHTVNGTAIAAANAFSVSTCAILACNGTTDYFELMARQNSAGDDDTNQSSQFSSVLEWSFLRPL